MGRIGDRFARGSPVLIGYLMAGDPAIGSTTSTVRELVAAGLDILEFGVPFSDPVADGPTIQAAGIRARQAGTTLAEVLGMVSELRAGEGAVDIPILLMLYYNLIVNRGEADFVAAVKAAGVDGLIVPDLPLEEAGSLSARCGEGGLDLVLLASPASTSERIKAIATASRGFCYLVSSYGITGTQDSFSPEVFDLIARAKEQTAGLIPLGVGFGISGSEQARQTMAAGADAVIVGSALIEACSEGQGPALVTRIKAGLQG